MRSATTPDGTDRWRRPSIVPGGSHTSSARPGFPPSAQGPTDRAPAWLGPSYTGSSQHITPSSQSSSESVTITHPHHPLTGQRVDIVRIRRGPDPDLILRLADGTHTAIAMRWTDYATPAAPTPRAGVIPLLDVEGLWQTVQLLDHLRKQRHAPSQESPA